MTNTYSGSFLCFNCNEDFNLEVTKGTLRKEFTKNQKCPNCECLALSEWE